MVHSKFDTFSSRWSGLGGRSPGSVLMLELGGCPKSRASSSELPRLVSHAQWPMFLAVFSEERGSKTHSGKGPTSAWSGAAAGVGAGWGSGWRGSHGAGGELVGCPLVGNHSTLFCTRPAATGP